MDNDLRDLPIEVRSALHSIMSLGPSFKWCGESDSSKTMLSLEHIKRLIGHVMESEIFSLYSYTIDRS